jgi:hypothetical protein
MHGARGGAPKGSRNGNYRHGTRSGDVALLKAMARLVVQESRALLKSLDEG